MSGSQASEGKRYTAREGIGARQACQKATGTAQAMAGLATGAVAYSEECRCPWSGTGRSATAGNSAVRKRAAAAGGPDSAFARAAGAAGPAADTGSCSGRPWWAARPFRGVALAEGFYRRVIRRQYVRGSIALAMGRVRRAGAVGGVGRRVGVGDVAVDRADDESGNDEHGQSLGSRAPDKESRNGQPTATSLSLDAATTSLSPLGVSIEALNIPATLIHD